jgi:hypothetical protein
MKTIGPVAVSIVHKYFFILKERSGGDKIDTVISLFNHSVTEMFEQSIISIATIARVKIIRINDNGVVFISPDIIKPRMKIREREKRGGYVYS